MSSSITIFIRTLFLAAILPLSGFPSCSDGDADIISDFVIPMNNSSIDGNFFTFIGTGALIGTNPQTFKVIKASLAEFPALNGQSVSYTVLQFPAGSVNPPHTHALSAELLLLSQGTLQARFIDTTSKLFTQTLQAGDMFVFPKGLVHYQYNADEMQRNLQQLSLPLVVLMQEPFQSQLPSSPLDVWLIIYSVFLMFQFFERFYFSLWAQNLLLLIMA